MRQYKQIISNRYGFPKSSSILMRPERYHHLHSLPYPNIARGSGSSPTDGSLNDNQRVVLMERLNRILAFDEKTGLLRAEAGLTAEEILRFFVPRGWFLPVVPSSWKSTLGGSIATDTHGHNHHLDGSFSKHIHSLELILPNRKAVKCSPREEKDLFWATIGGMGLTGIISEVNLQMVHVDTAFIKGKKQLAQDFEQLFQLVQEAAKLEKYVYAWVDSSSNGKGIVVSAHHASLQELPKKIEEPLKITRTSRYPKSLHIPSWLIYPKVRKTFNTLYYHYQSKMPSDFLTDYFSFFFPFQMHDWSSKNGSISYEFFVPKQTGFEALKKTIEALSKCPFSPSNGLLHVCGKETDKLLSFRGEGFVFRFSLPNIQNEVFEFLNQLDQIVWEHGGRVSLAKDTHLSPATFRTMYSQLPQWQSIKNSIDPDNLVKSNLSQRLELGTKR